MTLVFYPMIKHALVTLKLMGSTLKIVFYINTGWLKRNLPPPLNLILKKERNGEHFEHLFLVCNQVFSTYSLIMVIFLLH